MIVFVVCFTLDLPEDECVVWGHSCTEEDSEESLVSVVVMVRPAGR